MRAPIVIASLLLLAACGSTAGFETHETSGDPVTAAATAPLNTDGAPATASEATQPAQQDPVAPMTTTCPTSIEFGGHEVPLERPFSEESPAAKAAYGLKCVFTDGDVFITIQRESPSADASIRWLDTFKLTCVTCWQPTGLNAFDDSEGQYYGTDQGGLSDGVFGAEAYGIIDDVICMVRYELTTPPFLEFTDTIQVTLRDWLIAICTTSTSDEGSSAPTTLPAPTICIRSNIDFAALRSAPDLDAQLLAEIPPGSCNVTLLDPVAVRGNGFDWFHVQWDGVEGWTAADNAAGG